MGKKYVSRVSLSIGGSPVRDIKNFKNKSVARRKTVKLMGATGVLEVTPEYGFTFDYVIPSGGNEFDFAGTLEGATVVVQKQGGGEITYSDVYLLEEGEETYDNENEAVRTIDCVALARDPQ